MPESAPPGERRDLRQQLFGAAVPELDDLQSLAPGQGAEHQQCKEESFHKYAP
jgi:hypothetical protein